MGTEGQWLQSNRRCQFLGYNQEEARAHLSATPVNLAEDLNKDLQQVEKLMR